MKKNQNLGPAASDSTRNLFQRNATTFGVFTLLKRDSRRAFFASFFIGGLATVLFPNTARADEIDDFLLSTMKQRQIPGLQIAVVRKGEIVKASSYGIANLQDSVPVDDETLFAINSMTKAFTGVAVMQLVEQGKLKLSTKASEILPDLPPAWSEVTIIQMLAHTSGLPNIMNNNTGRVIVGDNEKESWLLVQQKPVEFAPNEQFSYNQTNYLLLGKIIDKLSGHPFTDFITNNQLKRVSMHRTVQGGFAHYDEVVPHSARGYSTINSDKVIGAYESFPPSLRTAAGMSTTAKELAKWLIALQAGKLFSESDSLTTLWTPAVLSNGKTGGFGRMMNGYAMGWPIVGRDQHPAVAAVGGGRSAMFVYPRDELSIVVLTNLQGAFPERFMDELAGFYFPDMKESNGFGVPAEVKLLLDALNIQGYQHAIPVAEKLTKEKKVVFNERDLNNHAYRMVSHKRVSQALEIFKLNVFLFPKSSNSHDSLAEQYAATGEIARAIEHYQLALALSPGNTRIEGELKKLDAKLRK